MEYTKGKWKLPCGCSIFLEPNSPPILTYCSKHEAAPALYEALKQAQEGTGDWRGVIDLALAEADGK